MLKHFRKPDKYVLILTLLIVFMPHGGNAQSGDFLIKTTHPDIQGIDNLNFEIVQNNEDIILTANRSGVLFYDGNGWEMIKSPNAILSLAVDDYNNIFAGGLNNIGKISLVNRELKYISLSDQITFDNDLFFETLTTDHKVFFGSENKVLKYDPDDGSSTVLRYAGDEIYFNQLFAYKNAVWVNNTDGSNQRIYPKDLPDTVFYLPDSSNLVFFRHNPYNDKILTATDNGSLYLLSDGNISELEQSVLFKNGLLNIIDGDWIDSTYFGIGTLEEGCYILKNGDPEYVRNVSFRNGLPDNEVYAVKGDKSGGLWIAHEFGLSRIAPELPFHAFSNYPGLEGKLISAKRLNGRLFITTSIGTYYFDEENQYKTEVYYEIKDKKIPVNNNKTHAEKNKEYNIKEKKRENRGFLGLGRQRPGNDKDRRHSKAGFFRKLINRIDNVFEGEQNTTDRIKGKRDENKEYIRKTRKKLVSQKFLYRSISGFNTKCKDVFTFQGKVLVASNAGIFEINQDSAVLVIPVPVLKVIVANKGTSLLISSFDRSVRLYKLSGNLWIESDNYMLNDIILQIWEDHDGWVWLAGTSQIYKTDIVSDFFTLAAIVPYPNDHFHTPVLTYLNDHRYLINGSKYFILEDDTIREDFSLFEKLGKPEKYLRSSNGDLWVNDGKIWYCISEKGVEPFTYLSLFPNMVNIDFDREQNKFWLITADNRLYAFDPAFGKEIAYLNDLVFEKVQSNKGLLSNRGKLQLDYDENNLHFEIIQPDYLGFLKVEYQYKLNGMMKDWSTWITENTISFNFLQPGRYTLQVKSRDVFGRIQESAPYDFRILPPYWKTPWFYAIEFIVFGGLLLISARLNRSNVKYRFVTDALSILTLVLIIEFIQSTTQAYLGLHSSPLIDFFINVCIALLVFPLEQFLRRYILKNPE